MIDLVANLKRCRQWTGNKHFNTCGLTNKAVTNKACHHSLKPANPGSAPRVVIHGNSRATCMDSGTSSIGEVFRWGSYAYIYNTE